MSKYNICYYFDDCLIFKDEKSKKNITVIVNYLTYKPNAESIKKAIINDIIYYEIVITDAVEIIKKDLLYLYNKLECHLLKFIAALINNTPDDLIVYLSKTNYYSQKELEFIEFEFNKKEANTQISHKKYKTI